jgi:hypothetical protein
VPTIGSLRPILSGRRDGVVLATGSKSSISTAFGTMVNRSAGMPRSMISWRMVSDSVTTASAASIAAVSVSRVMR